MFIGMRVLKRLNSDSVRIIFSSKLPKIGLACPTLLTKAFSFALAPERAISFCCFSLSKLSKVWRLLCNTSGKVLLFLVLKSASASSDNSSSSRKLSSCLKKNCSEVSSDAFVGANKRSINFSSHQLASFVIGHAK